MTDARLDITMAADEKAVIKAQANLIGQLDKAIEKYKKLGSESRKTTKESEKYAAAAAKELERFANATKMINRTPLERYADTMRQLNTALKAGKLDQETFNRAAAKAKQEFDGVARASKNAFGSGANSGLMSMITRLGTLATAAAGARRILDDARSEADTAGQTQAEQAPSLGMLAQVADTPEDMRRLVSEAKRTFAEGGAKTIDEAAGLQFALESGGVGDMRRHMSRLQASGLVPNATLMAESAIKMQKGMGTEEAGSFRQIISKAFGGAKLGLGSAEELLAGTASVSSQASRLGLTDEEVMAAISTVSAVEGPAEASTQIQALLKGIEVEGIGGGFLEKGKTLREQVSKLQELEKSGEDIREMLGGRQEAVKGYGQLISDDGKTAMEKNLANIETAVQDDWMQQKVGMATNVPENRAAMMLRKKQNQESLKKSDLAMQENIADTMTIEASDAARQRYGGGRMGDIAASGERMGIGIHRWAFGNESFINTTKDDMSRNTQHQIEQIEAAKQLNEAAANLNAASQEVGRTNAARANQAAAGGTVEAR